MVLVSGRFLRGCKKEFTHCTQNKKKYTNLKLKLTIIFTLQISFRRFWAWTFFYGNVTSRSGGWTSDRQATCPNWGLGHQGMNLVLSSLKLSSKSFSFFISILDNFLKFNNNIPKIKITSHKVINCA